MLRVRTALSGWAGGPGLMTHYFLTPIQDEAAALRCVTYVHDLFLMNIHGLWPSTVALTTSGDVDVLTAASGLITDTLSVAAPAVVAGVGSAAQLPPASAALMQLRTSAFVAGRRVRGRIYLSPIAAEWMNDIGELTTTQHDALVSGGELLRDGTDTGDAWCVWHRPKAGAGGQTHPITAISVPYKLAVLTSRRD